MTISTLHLLCSIANGAVWFFDSTNKRIKSLVAKKYVAKAKKREWLIITPLGRQFLREARSVKL